MSQVTITIDRHEAGLIADQLKDIARKGEDRDIEEDCYGLLDRLSDMFRNAANSYDKEKGEFR